MPNDEEPGWTKVRIRQAVDELIKYGPSIKVGVAPLPFRGAESVVGALALIDTGAAGTGIGPRLASKLNLSPVGPPFEIREAGREPIRAQFFGVRLLLPRMDIELEVAGLPSLGEPHDVLLGRDILTRCRLAIDFTNGRTALHIKHPV